MKYLKYASVVTVILIFINCSTPYQPKGALGGYSEERMLDNMYRVEYQGNQHSKPEKIQNYLMYRCAELTQEKGYEYFAILSEERHFDDFGTQPESNTPYSSRNSSSSGMRVVANPDLQNPTNATNYTGVFVIKLLEDVDKNLKKAVFNVDEVLEELNDIVKK